MKDKKQKSTHGSVSFLAQVESMPEPKRTELKAAVSELIMLNMADRLGDRLSEQQAEEFGRIAEASKSPDEVMDWLTGIVPDMAEIRDEVIAAVDANLSERFGDTGGAA